MHKRIRIITTALDRPSPSRSSPTRSPLSPIAAPNEVKPRKKSIRQVALEYRQKVASYGVATLAPHPPIRRRTVKLWGMRLEMVEEATKIEPWPRSFKWVRGEAIGRGRAYLGLNVTTGEMIAVKQYRIPHNADELPVVLLLIHGVHSRGSIRENIRKYGTFDTDVVKWFASQILDGLIYLHGRGLIHGALKSSNILVELTGTFPRTIFWTAPEIIRTQYKAYDSMADIWSLGCIVLEMLTGKRPWFNTEAIAVMYKLYHQTVRPLPPADSGLDPVAADFMEKCLALRPQDRLSAVQLKQHPFLQLSPIGLSTDSAGMIRTGSKFHPWSLGSPAII
ncbi:kinase-like protein [Mycena leptocephala]|nr:kinase-like protein [Mycena leptocephala]